MEKKGTHGTHAAQNKHKKFGIAIEDRDLDRLRRLNETNVSKTLITTQPVPTVFCSQNLDYREQVLEDLKKEIDKNLEIKIPYRY